MEIQETILSPVTYLTLKKSIPISQISDKTLYDIAGKKLGTYMREHALIPSGSWSVLYFTWDIENKQTDIGIAFPVNNLINVEDSEFSIVSVPESKASMTVLKGSYAGLASAHEKLMSYTTGHEFNKEHVPVMAIEEYIVGPMTEPDEQKWLTHIYYLHD